MSDDLLQDIRRTQGIIYLRAAFANVKHETYSHVRVTISKKLKP